MIKAVIFDMDGVIADTQHFHDQANAEILQSYGVPLKPQELSKYAGIPQKELFENIFDQYNVKVDIEKAVNDKWVLIKKLAKNIEPIPGLREFIQKLHNNNFSFAVASSCNADFIEYVLNALKIKNLFKGIVSNDEVLCGKPNPDIFLKAAEKLGVNPDNCVVIEDAISGVQAAKRAGMKCIAITTTHNREDLRQADRIINHYSELKVTGGTIT